MELTFPEIFVVAGPNGAGKTTIARDLLPKRVGVAAFVNADLIAQGLSPHEPERSAMQAGRVMLERIHALRDAGESFAFETTLASRSFASFLMEARHQGYLVHLLFLALRSPELALTRVAERVERGGHDVPEATVRRRYRRGLANFEKLYRPLSDTWILYDNSGPNPMAIALGDGAGDPRVLDGTAWDQLWRSHAGTD